jgi:serine protease Do
MLDPVRAKAKLVALTATAFAGGVLVASGLEWTTGSHAATLFQGAPSGQDVKPVAELSQAFISIAESVTPAVVSIETERTGGPRRGQPQIPEELRDFFPFEIPEGGGGRQAPQTAGGSGFLITPDGYIVTNNHVVEGATKVVVVLSDNRRMDARLIGGDPTTDIAVVKVEGSGLPTVRIGSSQAARIGEWVLAIGNPLGLTQTVTAGIVSAKGRSLGIVQETSRSRYAIEDFIQTDAAINPGNSGGPLVNLRGEVIGVNSVIASRTGYYSGYGFAIPIDLGRKIADDLIRHGRVRRPALGVSIRDVSTEDAEVYRLPRVAGVLVNDFADENSAAKRAGLRQGDVIVGVNGAEVAHTGELQRIIATRAPGETVTVDVFRSGRRMQFRVQLGEATAQQLAGESQQRTGRPRAEAEPTAPVEVAKLGIMVAPMTAELARRFEFRTPGGVVITDVDPSGAGVRRGLRPGLRVVSVDGQAVQNAAQLQRIVAAKQPRQIVSVVLQDPQGQQLVVNVRLPG